MNIWKGVGLCRLAPYKYCPYIIWQGRLWLGVLEYVHYGCNADDYNINKFKKVKNIPFSTKPSGGFWASRSVDRKNMVFDWAAFCREAEFQWKGDLDCKFYFCLDIDAHIAVIKSIADYKILPKIKSIKDIIKWEITFIDFEECVRQGIDAIEYAYSVAHQNENIGDEMDIAMLGWDCDSILIMNSDIILKNSFRTE